MVRLCPRGCFSGAFSWEMGCRGLGAFHSSLCSELTASGCLIWYFPKGFIPEMLCWVTDFGERQLYSRICVPAPALTPPHTPAP